MMIVISWIVQWIPLMGTLKSQQGSSSTSQDDTIITHTLGPMGFSLHFQL